MTCMDTTGTPKMQFKALHTTQTEIQNSCVAMLVDKANSAVKTPAADFYGYWRVKPVATLPPQSVYFYRPWREKKKLGIQ